MKIFFAFNSAVPSASAALFLERARRKGHTVCAGAGAQKSGLADARVLVVFFETPQDLRDPGIRECYTSFRNDVAWKKKERGDIVLVLGPEIKPDRLPFQLRECRVLSDKDVSGLEKILNEFAESDRAASAVESRAAGPGSVVQAAAPDSAARARPVATPSFQGPAAQTKPSAVKPPESSVRASAREKKARALSPRTVLKLSLDWLWLVLLIPLSVLALYGVSVFARYRIGGGRPALLTLAAGGLALLLYSPFRAPFGTSGAVVKAAGRVRCAALIACLAFDVIFLNHRTGSYGLTPFWAGRADVGAGLPFVLTYAAVTALSSVTLIGKYSFLKRYCAVCPLTVYIACHVFDALPAAAVNAKLYWMAILLYLALLAGFALRSLAGMNRVPRFFLRLTGGLAASALIALAVMNLLL